MTGKVRRVDYYPDEMISGVAGKLSPLDFGVYWMICSLIASRGGPIDNDPAWIAQIFRRGTRPSDIRAAIRRLIEARKCAEVDGKLHQTRMELEVERAAGRIQSARENGARGGRPRKDNKGLGKAPGSAGAKLTANRQPSTSTDSPSSPIGEAVPQGSPGLAAQTVLASCEAGSECDPVLPPKAKTASARGCRLPDDWRPSPQARRAAYEEGLSDAEIDRCADRFRDYWHAQPGARGRRADWLATWRNWVRRDADDGRAGPHARRRQAGGGAEPGGGGAADRGFAASVARAVERLAAEPPGGDGSA
ncbi:MAG: hypothetical protein ACTS10_12495 [Kiloniellales bacterium]